MSLRRVLRKSPKAIGILSTSVPYWFAVGWIGSTITSTSPAFLLRYDKSACKSNRIHIRCAYLRVSRRTHFCPSKVASSSRPFKTTGRRLATNCEKNSLAEMLGLVDSSCSDLGIAGNPNAREYVIYQRQNVREDVRMNAGCSSPR